MKIIKFDVSDDEGSQDNYGDDEGLGQSESPINLQTQPRRPSYTRSFSEFPGGSKRYLDVKLVPQVTVSDFSALNLDVDTSKHTG